MIVVNAMVYIVEWPLGSMTLPFRVTHRLGTPTGAGKQAGGAQNITFLFISMFSKISWAKMAI